MRTRTIEEQEQIEAVIRECKVCYLAMNGRDGIPYVVPMNFGYENNVFYLHSGPEGKKLELLAADNRVRLIMNTGEELTFQHPDVACSYSMVSKSVMCTGKVEFIENFDEKIKALDIMIRHYTQRSFGYSAPAVKHIRILRIAAENITCKTFGNSIKRRSL